MVTRNRVPSSSNTGGASPASRPALVIRCTPLPHCSASPRAWKTRPKTRLRSLEIPRRRSSTVSPRGSFYGRRRITEHRDEERRELFGPWPESRGSCSKSVNFAAPSSPSHRARPPPPCRLAALPCAGAAGRGARARPPATCISHRKCTWKLSRGSRGQAPVGAEALRRHFAPPRVTRATCNTSLVS
jgi:hypothetical protein